MATPQERLAELRKRKRLAELRTKQTQAAPTILTAPTQEEVQSGQVAEEILGFNPIKLAKGLIGGVEAAVTIGSSALADPAAGIAGIGTLATDDSAEAAKTVEKTKELFTFQPGEEGQETLQNIGNLLQSASENPVVNKLISEAKSASDFITKIGDFTGRAIGGEEGSRIGKSIADAVPRAAAEGLSLKGFSSVSKFANKSLKNIPTPSITTKTPSGKIITDSTKIANVAPTIEQLKDSARVIYNEIDNLGVSLKPESFQRFADDINTAMTKEGFTPRGFPKVAGALEEISGRLGNIQNTTDLTSLRRIAQEAAKSIDKSEARLGRIMVDRFDNFLEKLGKADTIGATDKNIGKLFKDAGELWRRASKGDMVEKAIEDAALNKTGVQPGLKSQFASILKSPKKSKAFTPDEKKAMERVVKGGRRENVLNFIGKAGLSENQRVVMLTALGASGFALGGGAGAGGLIAIPLLGNFSKFIAEKITTRGANFVSDLVRSGKDGNEIIKTYLKNTPKKQRSAEELTQLLMQPDVKLANIRSQASVAKDAVSLVENFKPQELALAFGLIGPNIEQEVTQ